MSKLDDDIENKWYDRAKCATVVAGLPESRQRVRDGKETLQWGWTAVQVAEDLLKCYGDDLGKQGAGSLQFLLDRLIYLESRAGMA